MIHLSTLRFSAAACRTPYARNISVGHTLPHGRADGPGIRWTCVAVMYHIDMVEVVHMNVIHYNGIVHRTKQKTASVAMMMVVVHVEADVVMIGAIMMAGITMVYSRTRHEKQTGMDITQVNTESPTGCRLVDWTIEILRLQEMTILGGCQDITEVVVANIQIVIIVVNGPLISIKHIVHNGTDGIDKVVIDFIHIIHLPTVETKFITHLVGKIQRFLADPGTRHCSAA